MQTIPTHTSSHWSRTLWNSTESVPQSFEHFFWISFGLDSFSKFNSFAFELRKCVRHSVTLYDSDVYIFRCCIYIVCSSIRRMPRQGNYRCQQQISSNAPCSTSESVCDGRIFILKLLDFCVSNLIVCCSNEPICKEQYDRMPAGGDLRCDFAIFSIHWRWKKKKRNVHQKRTVDRDSHSAVFSSYSKSRVIE